MDIGVTGHRILEHSKEYLIPKVEDCFSTYYVSKVHTGMAWGFDLFVTWYCYSNNIPFVAHIAFPDQHNRYPQKWKDMYEFLLPKAKEVITYNDAYNKRIYFRRDEGLVDCSDLVLAYYDGRTKGGTYFTVKYAMNRQREVYNVL